jgi:hypothetical protein
MDGNARGQLTAVQRSRYFDRDPVTLKFER